MRPLWLLLGIGIGIVIGGYMQSYHSKVSIPVSITEQIVLVVPKDQKDAEKQLLYMAASKGMLEEIHRQKVLKDNEQKTRKR